MSPEPQAARGASTTRTRAAAEPLKTSTLAYREPFDIDALMRFLAQRAIPGVEAVQGRCVRRTVRAGALAAEPCWIEADFDADPGHVSLRLGPALWRARERAAVAVRRWLDLDAEPQAIDAALHELPGAPGLRLPGGVDAFELAVRAVLGQQVTVAAARTLARRLAQRFGTPVSTPWPELDLAFAAPATLAEASIESIASLGIIRSRAGAILALARAWPSLQESIDRRHDVAGFVEGLCALPGIGPWTAHYIAMRALGWADAFPPGDVAVLKAMGRLFQITTHQAAQSRASAWQPWRAYAVLRLWNSLSRPE